MNEEQKTKIKETVGSRLPQKSSAIMKQKQAIDRFTAVSKAIEILAE